MNFDDSFVTQKTSLQSLTKANSVLADIFIANVSHHMCDAIFFKKCYFSGKQEHRVINKLAAGRPVFTVTTFLLRGWKWHSWPSIARQIWYLETQKCIYTLGFFRPPKMGGGESKKKMFSWKPLWPTNGFLKTMPWFFKLHLARNSGAIHYVLISRTTHIFSITARFPNAKSSMQKVCV